jgi:hypothetical protein
MYIDPNDEFKVTPPTEEVVVEEQPRETESQPQTEETPEIAQASPGKPSQAQKDLDAQSLYIEQTRERNYRELRQLQEQKDRELEYLRREMEQLRQAKIHKEEEIGAPKDAFAEVGTVEKIVSKALQQQEERYKQQLSAQRAQENERMLNLQYKDLYQVLSPENLRSLEAQEPEIAATIAANSDTYSAKVAAYKWIKKLGIAEESENSRRVAERLNQNATRPKSPSTISPRQTSPGLSQNPAQPGFADTITDDMATRYRKEMEDAISRL